MAIPMVGCSWRTVSARCCAKATSLVSVGPLGRSISFALVTRTLGTSAIHAWGITPLVSATVPDLASQAAVGNMVLNEGVEDDEAAVEGAAVVVATRCLGGPWGEMRLAPMTVVIAMAMAPFLVE